MRSGKNTFVDFVLDNLSKNGIRCGYDFFAKDLKDYAKEDFTQIVAYLNEISEKYNIPEIMTSEDNWYEHKNAITRILLQTYGTEIIRNRVSKDYWVEKVISRLQNSTKSVIFISDVRFPSEVSDVANLDDDSYSGFSVLKVRVNRDSAIGSGHGTEQHPSETALDSYTDWDQVISNDGTLEDLKTVSDRFTLKLIEMLNSEKS